MVLPRDNSRRLVSPLYHFPSDAASLPPSDRKTRTVAWGSTPFSFIHGRTKVLCAHGITKGQISSTLQLYESYCKALTLSQANQQVGTVTRVNTCCH